MKRLCLALVVLAVAVGACDGGDASDGAATTVDQSTSSTEAATAPEPATTTTVSTTAAPTTMTSAVVVVDGRRPVATPAWGGIDQIEPLPGGGYVAVGRDRSHRPLVMWSPNGVDWFDGDPQQQVEPVKAHFLAQSLAVVGDQVAVLHHSPQQYEQGEIALSIGDPRTGTWKRVSLDMAGVEGGLPGASLAVTDERGVSLAANDEEVLVAKYAAPVPAAERQGVESTQVVVWLVDAERATSTRNSFADSATLTEADSAFHTPFVEWVEERWIMIAHEDAVGPEGDERTNTLWTSPDGRAWSQVAMPEDMDGVSSVRAGPSGVAASTCGMVSRVSEPPEDGFWYSSDGLDWRLVPQPGGHDPVIASWGDRGFVVGGPAEPCCGVYVIASDWSGMVLMPSPFNGASAAAASGDTLIVSPSGSGLWLYQEPTGE